MLETIWQVLNAFTMGSLLWLIIVLLLAVLGELGLPATSPILEGLLVFSGFQIVHGTGIVAAIPFLAVVWIGRLAGSSSTYWLSSSRGNALIDKFGRRIRLTQERLGQITRRIETVTLPSVIIARFIPGFSLATSVACGISRINYKKFLIGVTAHIMLWEAIFLSLGAFGGRMSAFFDPQSHPLILVIWIVVSVVIGAIVTFFVFRRIRQKEEADAAR